MWNCEYVSAYVVSCDYIHMCVYVCVSVYLFIHMTGCIVSIRYTYMFVYNVNGRVSILKYTYKQITIKSHIQIQNLSTQQTAIQSPKKQPISYRSDRVLGRRIHTGKGDRKLFLDPSYSPQFTSKQSRSS